MLFINTRPEARAKELTLALQDVAVPVIDLPLLELRTRPLSIELKQLYIQLFDASVIVVVSPTAVELGMAYLQQCGINLAELSGIQWISVGEKTAKTLSRYHIDSIVPRLETSEGMLQLPVLNTLVQGAKIAFWRGEGGRQFMMDHLRQQGMQILNFILYERHFPVLSKIQIEHIRSKLTAAKTYIILMTSEASWLNWLNLIGIHTALLNKGTYLVLGERLFNILDDYKKQHDLHFQVITLENLKTESIRQCVLRIQGKL
jgi:uroporphyrinogen-III synthase